MTTFPISNESEDTSLIFDDKLPLIRYPSPAVYILISPNLNANLHSLYFSGSLGMKIK